MTIAKPILIKIYKLFRIYNCFYHNSLSSSARNLKNTKLSVGYKINDSRDQITLDQPILDPQVGTEVYNLLWKKGGNTMSWTPGDGTSTTSFLWTKE